MAAETSLRVQVRAAVTASASTARFALLVPLWSKLRYKKASSSQKYVCITSRMAPEIGVGQR